MKRLRIYLEKQFKFIFKRTDIGLGRLRLNPIIVSFSKSGRRCFIHPWVGDVSSIRVMDSVSFYLRDDLIHYLPVKLAHSDKVHRLFILALLFLGGKGLQFLTVLTHYI